jgi:acylglycerol lipase
MGGHLDSPPGLAYSNSVSNPTEALTGKLQTTDGGELFWRSEPAQGAPRAALLLVHGLGEHSGRYGRLFAFLAARGVACWGYDHRGHGLSSGERGTVDSFDVFLDDLELMHRRVKELNPGLPLVLMAHSMGGLIATAYLLERSLKPDLLVLSGPAIVPTLDPEAPAIDPTRLTRDPAEQALYLSDPLILRERVQESLYLRLLDGLMMLPEREAEIKVPTLLIHGADDKICSPEGARDYVEKGSSDDKTVKIYPEGRHELLNDVIRDEVTADLWTWLEARL